MSVQPYLFFNGRAEEAIEFYKKAIDAKVEMLLRFGENPDKGKAPPEGASGCGPMPDDNKVMHSSLRIGADGLIMISDGMGAGSLEFKGISLTLPVRTEAECTKLFNALADGGQVQMPLAKTFFSPLLGCVGDKFGVSWMVIVDTQQKN